MAIQQETYLSKLNLDLVDGDFTGTGDKLVTDQAPTINDASLTGAPNVPTGSMLTIDDAPVNPTDAVNLAYLESVIVPTAPMWVKVTKTYSDLSAAALVNTIELYSLPAKYVVSGVKIKHSLAFSGGTISSYKIKIGVTGTLARLSKDFDVFAAAAATNLKTVNTQICFDEGSATSIKITATSVGDNLDQASAGSVDVWLLISNPDA